MINYLTEDSCKIQSIYCIFKEFQSCASSKNLILLLIILYFQISPVRAMYCILIAFMVPLFLPLMF